MKNFLFIATAAVMLASCSNGNNYTATITLPTMDAAGKTAYLLNGDNNDTVATAVVTDSILKFEGSIEKPIMGMVIVNNMQYALVVEPGNIVIGNDGKPAGTKLNEEYSALFDSLTTFQQSAQEVVYKFNSAAIDSLTAENEITKIRTKFNDILKSAYKTHNADPIGFWAFNIYARNEGLSLEAVQAELADKPYIAASQQVGKLIEELEIQAKTAEGAKFVDFTVTDGNGKEQKLSDYVGKGNYVLADFWASWCGPCRAEIPNIRKIYDKYNGKGLTVLGIAIWDKPEDTQKAIEELQIPWAQITNAGSVPSELYGIQGIPHIILFGPDGTIVARDLRGDDMIAKVDEVMKK